MVEIDFLAKRYGKAPSDFLKLSADEFQFNLLVATHGTVEESKQSQRAQKRARMRGK